MSVFLAGGYVWVRPETRIPTSAGVRFVEKAEASGCLHRHGMCELSPRFANIMPWLTSVGAAVASADYDGDDWPDLYVTSSGPNQKNRLLRNRGDGTFEDVTDAVGAGCENRRGANMHAIWGDIDNDGDLDLYVVKWAEDNILLRQDRSGAPAQTTIRFSDVSRTAGVDYWGYGNGATFLDYDRDGWLDLFVANYFMETVKDPQTGQEVRNDLWSPASTRVMHETFTHARNGGHNVLYRNRGDGTFEDVTQKVGLSVGGWALAVGSGDLNNDGWPDIYVANDFGPDEYYLNTGATEATPRFRLVRDPHGHPGIGADWWKGMNVDMADVNNDGYLDIYVTNILSRKYKTDEGNMLWLNCADAQCPGGRNFRNIAAESGSMDGGWGWGGKFADFNCDGLLDIFTVNGFVTGDPNRTYWYHIQEMVTQTKNQTVDALDWPVMGNRDLSGYEPSRLYIQQASRGRNSSGEMPTFVEAAQEAGITDTYNGRGIAIADFNRDGLLDMYVANQGAPGSYYLNQSTLPPGTSFLRIKLQGDPALAVKVGNRAFASTRDAIGARVTLLARNGRQIREVQGGMGFASQSEFPVHFGVPDPASIERVIVQWPSGRSQEVGGEEARKLIGRHIYWVEGQPPHPADPSSDRKGAMGDRDQGDSL